MQGRPFRVLKRKPQDICQVVLPEMPPIRDPDTSRRVVHNLEGLAADLVLVGQEYQRMRAALLEIAALPDGTPADEFRTRARGALGGASE